ncbi:hypothetical protein K440DRAFT_608219 [Wilcoxina mikolae CBS 423.85]|nr:hypothetical protein K440DRAFT_608219 [Wilcoxina mikolae CBS 423.85]
MSLPQQLQIPAAIDRALSRFQDSLDSEGRKIFSNVTTEDDVRSLIESLEAEQGSRGCLRNLNRVKPFINGLSQYATVIEVFVQVNPQILSFIWVGSLRRWLTYYQLSSKFTESFDRLLDACQKIGENLPRFVRFAGIFKYSDRIQNVIALLYDDILEFYRRTLKFFRRRAWDMFFRLAWGDFQSRFGYIVDNIRRHQQLIDSEACAEEIDQAHRARELAREQLEESLRQAQMKRRKECANWLSPADMETDKDTASRVKTPGTTEWLLRTRELKDWIHGGQAVRAVWLSGIPGAGKTVLSSSVIEHLQTMQEAVQSTISSVLYFFCSYKQPDKNTCLAMLRSFIYQIILQDEQLISYVYEQFIGSPHSITVVMCKKMLSHLLGSCAPSGTSKTFMIIDGLDELPEAERDEFLPIMKHLLTKEPFDTVLRVFIASQDLPDISKAISRKSTRISVGDKNQKDIRTYIELATDDLVERLELDEEDPEMGKQIIESLTERAGGMFLWVRLVIHGLLTSATSEEISNTLKNLPVGLEQTYERILDRIRSLSQGERALAMKLLQWITCSTRLMTLRELQVAVGIQRGDITVDKGHKPLPAKLRSVCGPIVEIVGEDTVVFVHFSAKEYLLSEHSGPFVDQETAHLDIAIASTTYMGFTCFDSDLCDEDATRYVLSGDLRLLEYVLSS